MNINRFKEFEAYAAALVHADLGLMLPRLIEPRWEVATQSLGSFELQFGKEGCGIIAEGAVQPNGQTLFVPMAGLQFANGQPLHDHSVLVLGPGAELAIASQEAHSWCSVYFPVSNESSANADPGTPGSCSKVVNIGNEAMTRLRRLVGCLEDSLRLEPALTNSPAVAKCIQADLLEMFQPIVATIGAPSRTMGRPSFPRREIIRRTLDKIGQHEDGLVSMEDLTRAVNVSERTLRNIFLEYYGMPLRRYLFTRRLHQVRSELQLADPEYATVTAIAAQFGFWHFGRFASQYRRLFGEAPSQTLKCKRKSWSSA